MSDGLLVRPARLADREAILACQRAAIARIPVGYPYDAAILAAWRSRPTRGLEALIAASRFEWAAAWLAAIRAEAWLLGSRCRDRTLELGAWLRVRQARHEEASRLCRAIRAAGRRRSIAAVVRWTSGVDSREVAGATMDRVRRAVGLR